MRIFVTGVCGQLGHDVANEAMGRGYEVFGSDIQMTYSGIADGSAVTQAPYVLLDITDREDVFSIIEEIRPDTIIHCAAWTDVDAAEEEANREKVPNSRWSWILNLWRYRNRPWRRKQKEESLTCPVKESFWWRTTISMRRSQQCCFLSTD